MWKLSTVVGFGVPVLAQSTVPDAWGQACRIVSWVKIAEVVETVEAAIRNMRNVKRQQTKERTAKTSRRLERED